MIMLCYGRLYSNVLEAKSSSVVVVCYVVVCYTL